MPAAVEINKAEPKRCADCHHDDRQMEGYRDAQGAWLLICEPCRNHRRAVKAARTKALCAQQVPMFPEAKP